MGVSLGAKIFGKLWEISKRISSKPTQEERNFVKSVRFGLVAVDVMGAARHFCGFANYPTSYDWDNLKYKLRTDKSFGLIGEYFTLERAPQEVVDCYRRELGGG